MDRQALISELVGEAYPVAVPLAGRLRRNWIARTASALPNEAALAKLREVLEQHAFDSITSEYSSSTSPQRLAQVRPLVTLTKLDEHHLVVRIEFAPPENTVGDVAMISQWGVLQALDRQVRLDELQGLPSEYWFPLRAAREKDTST